MKKDENNKINLIVPLQPTQKITLGDRSGGKTQSIGSAAKKVKNYLFGSNEEVNLNTVKDNLENCLSQVNNILKGVKQDAIEGWDLDSISVSLAVSAEGSIGIATAGVEASVEVSFSRKSSSK